MWVDIHAHLYDKTDDDLTLCLKNAQDNKVDIIVNSSTNIETTDTVIEQIKNNIIYIGFRFFSNILLHKAQYQFNKIDNRKGNNE